ncbi:MAG: cell wall-binding repeat-containing protein [Actinobacteria bacterium]|nr:cell wall-binding repeat-containing protein [Actinomycetota bacterium]
MPSSVSPRRLRLLRALPAVFVAVSLAVTQLVGAEPAHAASGVQRVHDRDRVSTAVAVATQAWGHAPHVLLATASDYPDAIAGAALAARRQGPVLLTPPDHVPVPVWEALRSLGTTDVTILGGGKAVTPAVEQHLRAAGYAVQRASGPTRYHTAAVVAGQVNAGGDVPLVAVAVGSRADGRDAWPDALSAASLAGLNSPAPTLLAADDHLPDATRDALQQLAPDRVMVLGGPGAVSDAVVQQIAGMDIPVERAAGSDRFATSVRVAQAALDGGGGAGTLDGQQVVFASGENFPDALGAGALAARRSAPLVLVPGGQLADGVDAFLRSDGTDFEGGVLVGGPVAVSGFVHQELEAALAGAPRPTPPPPPPPAPEPSCAPNSSPDCRYTYHHPISTWESLARCESGGNWAINTGNGYYGGLQFALSSWRAVGGTGYPHQQSKWEQIYRGELLQSRQGWGAWPSCSRKIGLR